MGIVVRLNLADIKVTIQPFRLILASQIILLDETAPLLWTDTITVGRDCCRGQRPLLWTEAVAVDRDRGRGQRPLPWTETIAVYRLLLMPWFAVADVIWMGLRRVQVPVQFIKSW